MLDEFPLNRSKLGGFIDLAQESNLGHTGVGTATGDDLNVLSRTVNVSIHIAAPLTRRNIFITDIRPHIGHGEFQGLIISSTNRAEFSWKLHRSISQLFDFFRVEGSPLFDMRYNARIEYSVTQGTDIHFSIIA